MAKEQVNCRNDGFMKITAYQRDSIMYIVGKLDGIMAAGCSFDGDEIKKLLEPIKNDLSAIIANEEI